MKSYSYSMQIKEHHLDTLGHVNNAMYLSLMEEARWELLLEQGLGLKEVQETAIGPVILEVNMKFLKELRNREWITIESHFPGFEGKVGRLRQVVKNSAGEEACAADFVVAVFDLKARRVIEPPPAWLALAGQ